MGHRRANATPALACAGVMMFLGALAAPLPALAQGDAPKGFTVTSQAAKPASPGASAYAERAARYGIDTAMTYATGLEGDITSGARKAPREKSSLRFGGGGNGLGVIMVILALMAALLLWLRFGGSGMLLARAPSDVQDKSRSTAPDSWRIDADAAARDPRGLLARLAALPDRRAAMVQLLRHCLLRAGDDSDTRFARADTEREAFARLPISWRHHDALNQLLRDTELVHYGGRNVTDQTFTRAFDLGGTMLQGARHA